MYINDVLFSCELTDIISELQNQLMLNHISLLTKTKNTSTDIMVQCPYHGDGQERRPSAGIRKSDGQFHCFACNQTHSLPEVISYCLGKTKDVFGSYGWKWLNKNFSSVSVESRKDIDLSLERESIKKEINYVSEEELDGYRYYHPYWSKRKITDERIISLFDLGYDKQTACITMPVRDIEGNTLFIARRSVKTKFFNYPAGVEKPVYGLYELQQCDNYPSEVIICESIIDALTAWQYGGYAAALNGLGTARQFRELQNLPCRKLILATDSDKAGMSARHHIRENVKGKMITEYILPQGKKDLNELTKEEFENLEEIF